MPSTPPLKICVFLPGRFEPLQLTSRYAQVLKNCPSCGNRLVLLLEKFGELQRGPSPIQPTSPAGTDPQKVMTGGWYCSQCGVHIVPGENVNLPVAAADQEVLDPEPDLTPRTKSRSPSPRSAPIPGSTSQESLSPKSFRSKVLDEDYSIWESQLQGDFHSFLAKVREHFTQKERQLQEYQIALCQREKKLLSNEDTLQERLGKIEMGEQDIARGMEELKLYKESVMTQVQKQLQEVKKYPSFDAGPDEYSAENRATQTETNQSPAASSPSPKPHAPESADIDSGLYSMSPPIRSPKSTPSPENTSRSSPSGQHSASKVQSTVPQWYATSQPTRASSVPRQRPGLYAEQRSRSQELLDTVSPARGKLVHQDYMSRSQELLDTMYSPVNDNQHYRDKERDYSPPEPIPDQTESKSRQVETDLQQSEMPSRRLAPFGQPTRVQSPPYYPGPRHSSAPPIDRKINDDGHNEALSMPRKISEDQYNSRRDGKYPHQTQRSISAPPKDSYGSPPGSIPVRKEHDVFRESERQRISSPVSQAQGSGILKKPSPPRYSESNIMSRPEDQFDGSHLPPSYVNLSGLPVPKQIDEDPDMTSSPVEQEGVVSWPDDGLALETSRINNPRVPCHDATDVPTDYMVGQYRSDDMDSPPLPADVMTRSSMTPEQEYQRRDENYRQAQNQAGVITRTSSSTSEQDYQTRVGQYSGPASQTRTSSSIPQQQYKGPVGQYRDRKITPPGGVLTRATSTLSPPDYNSSIGQYRESSPQSRVINRSTSGPPGDGQRYPPPYDKHQEILRERSQRMYGGNSRDFVGGEGRRLNTGVQPLSYRDSPERRSGQDYRKTQGNLPRQSHNSPVDHPIPHGQYTDKPQIARTGDQSKTYRQIPQGSYRDKSRLIPPHIGSSPKDNPTQITNPQKHKQVRTGIKPTSSGIQPNLGTKMANGVQQQKSQPDRSTGKLSKSGGAKFNLADKSTWAIKIRRDVTRKKPIIEKAKKNSNPTVNRQPSEENIQNWKNSIKERKQRDNSQSSLQYVQRSPQGKREIKSPGTQQNGRIHDYENGGEVKDSKGDFRYFQLSPTYQRWLDKERQPRTTSQSSIPSPKQHNVEPMADSPKTLPRPHHHISNYRYYVKGITQKV